MLKLNKKVIIPIAILLSIVILIGIFSIINKPSNDKQVANKTEEVVDDVNNKETTAGESDNTTSELEPSTILTFDKDGGILKLYNTDGDLLDELDLKMLDIGVVVQVEDLSEDSKEESAEEKDEVLEEAEEKDEVLEEKHVVVKTLVGEDAVEVEIKGDKVIIYDENKEKVKEFSLKELLEKEEKIANEEEAKPKEKTNVNNYNLANNKLLNAPADTTFTNFRTIKDELVFRDNKRNALILVDVDENKIVANLVLKGVNLEGLSSVFLADNDIYLTFNNDKRITRIPKNKGLSGNISKDDITKYEIDAVPNFVYVENGMFYYTAENLIGRYDMTQNKNNCITEIDVGDKTLDMYVEEDFIYIINEFGKGNENSVLIKVNKKDFVVEEIMELKGIYSKFIGIDENTAYIRQKDTVKSVDLESMKPILAFPRKEGVPVLVDQDIVYILKNNVLKRAKIGETIEQIDSFNAEGFNFIIR